MNWSDFESNIRDVLEIPEDVGVSENDVIREMDYWSSMHALLVMAMAESDYDVSVSGEDILRSKTFKGLFDLINSRIE